MAKLTEARIARLKWDPTDLTKAGNSKKFQPHNDSEVGGHQIRVYPPKTNGQVNKVFWLVYGPATNRKGYRIGSWGEWTLEEARGKARKIRKDFYDLGIDPNKAKKEKAQNVKDRITVKQLAEDFREEHRSEWSLNYWKANRTHSGRLVDAYGSKPAESLHRDDIRSLFLKIKKKSPDQAKLFRNFVSRCYDWAMDEELIPEMVNPAILVRSKSKTKSQYKDTPTTERDRVLDSDKGEAAELFGMLKGHDPLWTHLVKLYLLLGWRNNELRLARWEHIDLENRLITNARDKKKNVYKSYLCDMAIDCLKALGLGRIAKGPIFPAAGKHKPTDESRSAWEYWYRTLSKDPRMPRDSDGRYIWIHDLRGTAVTYLEEMGFDNDTRTIFKGSKPKGVTARNYSHGKKEFVRKRCTLAIEERLRDVLEGREKTMFEPWRGRLNPTGLES